MDWEFGVSRCKLLHLEWINNKALLYTTGNYIQYPGINHNGKEYKNECIYVYNWVTLLYSTDCKSTIIQFFKKRVSAEMLHTYTIFLDWKNQYCQNDYTTQCNLQIQCNLYQITNGIFYGTRTNHLKICMEKQKTPNSQSSLEGKKRSWRNQTPWLQTILQSYSNQNSMVLAQNQKYRSMRHAGKNGQLHVKEWN